MSASTFTNAFGGPSPIVAADPSYEALTIASNTQLVWPLETTGGDPYVAKQIDVTASAGGLLLKMPPGNTGSNGPQALISNVGANTFTVTDTAGNAIAVIAATQCWLITLTDNSTTNGSWRALQIASTTSNASAASLAGPGLQAIGPLLQTIWDTRYTAVNSNVTPTDRSVAVVWTGAGTGTLSLNASATLTEGWFCGVKNNGPVAITLQCTGGDTIDGAGSLSIPPDASGIIILGAGGAFETIGAFITVLPIASGGTGATNATQALVNLGGSTIGISIFTAPNAAAILAILGLNQSTFTEASVSTNQVLNAGASNTIYVCTAALSLTLPLTTGLTNQFVIMVDASGGNVVLTPQVTDSINGLAAGTTLTVPQGGYCLVCTDAVGNWYTVFGPSATFTNVTATAISTATLVASGTITPAQVAGIVGTTTNNNAQAGSVGEYISSSVLVGSAVALVSGVFKDITTILLTAGDWEVMGVVVFSLAGTASVLTACINTVANTAPTLGAENNITQIVNPSGTGSGSALSAGPMRMSVAGATTVRLIGQATAGGALGGYGFIGARRIR